ncbi:MAG TPA: alpha/beta fold hydrolase [Acidimicrobiales bacterium]|nr:alpha/beta fold hydrolase [Acidimicrobiales bacterium]
MPTTRVGDVDVAWDEAGTGEALILVQGLGFAGEMWYRVVPLLAPRFRVITIDNRGTGATGAPPGPYTVEVMAGDVLAVMDAAGLDRANLLGISMGGLIVQQVAFSAPERLRSLILVATSAGDPERSVAPPAEVAQILASRASLPPRESIEATIPIAYAPTTKRELIDEDIRRRLERPTSAEGYTHQLLGASQWRGSVERLGQLKVPTLIVHGTDDGMVPVANAQVLADAIPAAELQLIEGAGHVLMTDAPDELAKAITAFIDRRG